MGKACRKEQALLITPDLDHGGRGGDSLGCMFVPAYLKHKTWVHKSLASCLSLYQLLFH